MEVYSSKSFGQTTVYVILTVLSVLASASETSIVTHQLARTQAFRPARYCPSPHSPAGGTNCIPWSLDPRNNGSVGYYAFGGLAGFTLSGNDTVIAVFHASKYSSAYHTQNDQVMRRSFDQGRTWQPFQMFFSAARFYSNITYDSSVSLVLDRHTGTIWGVLTANTTFLLVTSSNDHGATWSEPRDITNMTKPAGVGFVSTMTAGVQLASGRLVVCFDYIKGQWTDYPITHSRASIIYSDDHGASWHVSKSGGSPDGDTMNENTVAALPNNTLVMNARNYLGQSNHTVHRAIMWSHDEGDTWTQPYFTPDLPTPVEQGDMILGAHTDPSLGIGQPLFFTHPRSYYDRGNGTLEMSTNGGASWVSVVRYQHGCHSSSGIVQFKDGKLGIIFEDGGPFPQGYDPSTQMCKVKLQPVYGMNQTFLLFDLAKKTSNVIV